MMAQAKEKLDRLNTVKRQKIISEEAQEAIKANRPDRKLFAAKSRRQVQLSNIKQKAKVHNDRVLEKVQILTSEQEKQLHELEEHHYSKLKKASNIRHHQLLDVRYTAEKSTKPREQTAPVAFEIELDPKSPTVKAPAVKERLEKTSAKKAEVTLDAIHQKLTRAEEQRKKLQAEKINQAKQTLGKVELVNERRYSIERAYAMKPILLVRKQVAANAQRYEQDSSKQTKVKNYNLRVIKRVNVVTSEFQNQQEARKE
jgi:hypothetical protein